MGPNSELTRALSSFICLLGTLVFAGICIVESVKGPRVGVDRSRRTSLQLSRDIELNLNLILHSSFLVIVVELFCKEHCAS